MRILGVKPVSFGSYNGNGRPVISGIKVVNIFEGNAIGIEKMANKMITDLHKKIQKYSTFKKPKTILS